MGPNGSVFSLANCCSPSLNTYLEGGVAARVSQSVNFNPGVAVYVLSNVSATLSFGLGGLSYDSTIQYDREGLYMGESNDSKLSFKFNILAINIGINVHLWSYE